MTEEGEGEREMETEGGKLQRPTRADVATWECLVCVGMHTAVQLYYLGNRSWVMRRLINMHMFPSPTFTALQKA